MNLKPKPEATEFDHLCDIVTGLVDLLGQTRSEMHQRFDQQDKNIIELLSKAAELQSDVVELQSKMIILQSDIIELSPDVCELKVDNADVKALNTRFDQLELLICQALPKN